MSSKIVSDLTEEIEGEVQAPQLYVTMRRPDGYAAVFPANMVEALQKKGYAIAEPGEFTERREANVKTSFAAANADKIADAVMLAEAIADAIKPKSKAKSKAKSKK